MADPVSLGLAAAGTEAVAGGGAAAGGAAAAGGGFGLTQAVGAAGLGSSILGSLLQASGAKASANAQAGQLTYQAGIANLNAQIAQQNASYAQLQGEESASKYGIGARQTAGHIIANQAASGLDVRSGSAKQVQESQHTISTIDQNQIRENAAKVAYDYETQAAGAKAQATLDTMGASNVKAAGNINVASSLVGGAGSVATKWLQASQMGLFNGTGNTASSAANQSFGS